MKNFLERYKIKLTTITPVYIGSGRMLTKKEYFIDEAENKLSVMNFDKMFMDLPNGKAKRSFQRFLMKSSSEGFNQWFHQENLKLEKDWIAYDIDIRDCKQVFQNENCKGISTFQKDVYGCPFVSGSSLKGAIRTAILKNEINANSETYDSESKKIAEDIIKQSEQKKLKSELQKKTKELERKVLNNQNFSNQMTKNSDSMIGFRISDSKPLKLSDLIVCQKIDVHSKQLHSENKLPILRECLKPNTVVECILTLDRTYFKPSIIMIKNAIMNANLSTHSWNEKYFSCEQFDDENLLYIGGGVGYVSKTFTYDLLDEEKAKYLGKRVLPKVEGRQNDQVVPRVMKTTSYDGNSYEMGLCKVEFEKL